MEKIALIQKYDNPEGMQEKACLMLANMGISFGFDIIGIHKDRFERQWLLDADLIIIADIISLYLAQINELKEIIFNKKKLFVKCIMDLSEIENDSIDRQLYQLSKINYFCSPKIFKKYLEEIFNNSSDIKGCLSFLAGEIDDSWQSLPGMDGYIEEKRDKAITDFWRDINLIINKKKIINE